MIFNINKKKKIINEIKYISKKSLSIIIADLNLIKVNKINKLRKKARKKNVIIKVFRNNLVHIAFKNNYFRCLKKIINGPVIFGFSLDHPGSAARLFKKFYKKYSFLKIKAAFFEKKIILKEKINQLASLPTYKESLIKLILIIKEITIIRLLKIINLIKNKKKI